MIKIQRGLFIKLPAGFTCRVPKQMGKVSMMKPAGLHINWNHSKAWLHYAGERADESYAGMQFPSDPKFLRKFAEELGKLADKIEEGYMG